MVTMPHYYDFLEAIPMTIKRELRDFSRYEVNVEERFDLGGLVINCRCKACNQTLGMRIERGDLFYREVAIEHLRHVVVTLRKELENHMCKWISIQPECKPMECKSEHRSEIERILDI